MDWSVSCCRLKIFSHKILTLYYFNSGKSSSKVSNQTKSPTNQKPPVYAGKHKTDTSHKPETRDNKTQKQEKVNTLLYICFHQTGYITGLVMCVCLAFMIDFMYFPYFIAIVFLSLNICSINTAIFNSGVVF